MARTKISPKQIRSKSEDKILVSKNGSAEWSDPEYNAELQFTNLITNSAKFYSQINKPFGYYWISSHNGSSSEGTSMSNAWITRSEPIVIDRLRSTPFTLPLYLSFDMYANDDDYRNKIRITQHYGGDTSEIVNFTRVADRPYGSDRMMAEISSQAKKITISINPDYEPDNSSLSMNISDLCLRSDEQLYGKMPSYARYIYTPGALQFLSGESIMRAIGMPHRSLMLQQHRRLNGDSISLPQGNMKAIQWTSGNSAGSNYGFTITEVASSSFTNMTIEGSSVKALIAQEDFALCELVFEIETKRDTEVTFMHKPKNSSVFYKGRPRVKKVENSSSNNDLYEVVEYYGNYYDVEKGDLIAVFVKNVGSSAGDFIKPTIRIKSYKEAR